MAENWIHTFISYLYNSWRRFRLFTHLTPVLCCIYCCDGRAVGMSKNSGGGGQSNVMDIICPPLVWIGPNYLTKSVWWNGVLCRHFLGIKTQHWNACLSSLFKDFISFWGTLSTPTQREAWKMLKLPKIDKGCLKLSFFLWFTHWWNSLCETDWLMVGNDIKDILKFYKNELRH